MLNIKTKICTKCKEEKLISEFYYHRTRKYYMSSCKVCNSEACVSYQRNKRDKKDIKFIMADRAAQIRRGAKHRGIEWCDDLKSVLLDKWDKQCGKCYYTGIEMSIGGDYHSNNNAMTVDRIRSDRGYVEDNIVLCIAMVNRVKQNLSAEELKFISETFLKCIKDGRI